MTLKNSAKINFEQAMAYSNGKTKDQSDIPNYFITIFYCDLFVTLPKWLQQLPKYLHIDGNAFLCHTRDRKKIYFSKYYFKKYIKGGENIDAKIKEI